MLSSADLFMVEAAGLDPSWSKPKTNRRCSREPRLGA